MEELAQRIREWFESETPTTRPEKITAAQLAFVALGRQRPEQDLIIAIGRACDQLGMERSRRRIDGEVRGVFLVPPQLVRREEPSTLPPASGPAVTAPPPLADELERVLSRVLPLSNERPVKLKALLRSVVPLLRGEYLTEHLRDEIHALAANPGSCIAAVGVGDRFIRRSPRPTPIPPPSVEASVSPAAGWALTLGDQDAGKVFDYLEKHQTLTESELVGLLGSARRARAFAARLDGLVERLNFEVEVSAGADGKLYRRR